MSRTSNAQPFALLLLVGATSLSDIRQRRFACWLGDRWVVTTSLHSLTTTPIQNDRWEVVVLGYFVVFYVKGVRP